jgi:hypothetical protein
METKLRSELKHLYCDNWDRILGVRRQIVDGEPFGPFLIGHLAPYCSEPVKLMVVGQQTAGWGCSVDVEEQMAVHANFKNGQRTPPDEPYYPNSPFQFVTGELEAALHCDRYSCAYANINRFDVDCDKPTGPNELIIADLDFLLAEEISILNPEVCVFFTGPNFDARIRSLFDGVSYSAIGDWKLRQLCRLEHPRLPRNTFRTYHPNSMRWQRLIDPLVTEISRQSAH